MDGIAWAAFMKVAEAWLPFAAQMSLKASLALGLAAVVSLAQRRAAASVRHLTWALGVTSIIALPLVQLAAPTWRVEAWPPDPAAALAPAPSLATSQIGSGPAGALPAVVPGRDVRGAAVPTPDAPSSVSELPPKEPSVAASLFLLWLVGVAGLGVAYVASVVRLRQLVRDARLVADGPWRELADAAADQLGVPGRRFRLYAAADPTSPLAWGVFRVAVVLPPAFGTWSPARQRHVLLHELAHAKRLDCATQWLASLASTLHWFNPLVWLASRRMLAEREHACDDQVLLVGTRASAYADDLLQIARTVGGATATARLSTAMARRSQIADRLLAVLDPALRRGSLRRRTLALATGLTLAAVAPLASLTAAQEEPQAQHVVEGQVIDSEGAPVAGAEVKLQPALGGPTPPADAELEAETDASGAFRVTSDDPGPFLLHARHPDFAPRTLERVAAGGEPLEIVLDAGLEIVGRVLDANRGDPIHGARVRAASSFVGARAQGLLAEALTDAEGRFRLERLPAGAHVVSAAAAGYALAELRDTRAGEEVELALLPGSSIEGVVVDADGQPLPGARVRATGGVLPFRATVLEATEPTGDDGGFWIPGVEPGSYRVEVRKGGYAPLLSEPVAVEAELPARARLVLEEGAFVTGRLLTAEGNPTPGRLELRESQGVALQPERVEESRVDAKSDGGFRLGPLASGEHVLIATAPGHAATLVPVRVAKGDSEADVGEVTLEVGGWIRGRVVDEDGRPIAEAAVTAVAIGPPSTVRSGDDGAFELTGLRGERHRLTAAAPGYVLPYAPGASAASGAEDVVLELRRAGTVIGRVEDPDGRPITGFGVQLESEERSSGPSYYGPARPFGDAEGRFRLDDVVPGPHVLEVTAAGFSRAVVADVAVTAGETTDVGLVRLDHGAALSGTVVDESGAPVPGAELRLQAAARDSYWARQTARSGIGGAYRLEGLEPGRVGLLAQHRDYADELIEGIEIAPGQGEISLDVVLVRGGRIEGRIRRRDGQPIAGVPVTFMRDETGSLSFSTLTRNLMSTDADGRFFFASVLPGRTVVQVFARSGSTLEGVVDARVESTLR